MYVRCAHTYMYILCMVCEESGKILQRGRDSKNHFDNLISSDALSNGKRKKENEKNMWSEGKSEINGSLFRPLTMSNG